MLLQPPTSPHRVTFAPPGPWPGAELLLSTHICSHLSQPSSRLLVICVGRQVCVCVFFLSTCLSTLCQTQTLILDLLSNCPCPASFCSLHSHPAGFTGTSSCCS